MHLNNLYENYGFLHKVRPIARANTYGLFSTPEGYIMVDLLNSEVLNEANPTETRLFEYAKSQPMVIMADLEFCDLEYNDSILTNPTAFICEALSMGIEITIKPKEIK